MIIYKAGFLILLAGIFLSLESSAQESPGIGASAIYNFQTEGFGLGGRALIPLRKRIALVPQINYFLPFNLVHEINAGVNLNYSLLMRKRAILYLTGGGYFNYWINSDASPMPDAKPVNIFPDIGAGILFGKKSFRPFVEQRYNPLFREGSLHIGFLWFPAGRGKAHGADSCPAYK